MGCDHDRLQRRTERGGCVITTGGVRLNDEEKSRIDRSDVVLDIGHGGSDGKTVSAAHGLPGTRQNASVYTVTRSHPGNVGLPCFHRPRTAPAPRPRAASPRPRLTQTVMEEKEGAYGAPNPPLLSCSIDCR